VDFLRNISQGKSRERERVLEDVGDDLVWDEALVLLPILPVLCHTPLLIAQRPARVFVDGGESS